MKNWISWCLICCSAFVSLSAYAQATDKTFPAGIAQDSGGQVWAALGGQWNGSLFTPGNVGRWGGGGQWLAAETPPAITGVPGAMGLLPSGAVICLWSKGDTQHWLTVHRGHLSRLAAHWTGFLSAPRLFGDHSGNAWVTGLGGDIYRVPARLGDTSPAEHVDTIADADYYPGYQKSNEGTDQGREAGLFYHDPLFAAEDGQGRMWFWTDRLAGSGNFAALRGILRWEDGKIVYHPTLAGLPDKPLDWIAPSGKAHMWVAVHDTGIFQVDTETLSAAPVPEPESHAFQSVQTMFALGTDWYVVTGFPSNPHPQTPTGTLWRLRAGQWRKLIDGLDSQAIFDDFTRRPVLATPEGLWVGSYGLGAWLLPASGTAPVRLDWHYAYRLASTTRLFAVPSRLGGVLAFRANNANGAAVSPMQAHLEELVTHPKPGRFRAFATNHPLVQDKQGHVWNLDTPMQAFHNGIRAEASLREWDGSGWVTHPFPPEADPVSFSSLYADTLGRLWAVPWDFERPVYVFDPVGGRWQQYPSYKKAVLGQLDVPGFALLGAADTAPTYGTEQRVAFRGEGWHLNFFDGHLWHQWTRPEMIPHDTGFAFEPPFFRKDGQLSVNIDFNSSLPASQQKSWAWNETAGWHSVPYEEGPHDWIVRIRAGQITPPPGCPTPDFLSLVQDNHGVLWLTSAHVLYSVKDGKCEPVQPAGLPSPFLDGRRVTGAMTDLVGNTFLLTENGQTREYVLLPKPSSSK